MSCEIYHITIKGKNLVENIFVDFITPFDFKVRYRFRTIAYEKHYGNFIKVKGFKVKIPLIKSGEWLIPVVEKIEYISNISCILHGLEIDLTIDYLCRNDVKTYVVNPISILIYAMCIRDSKHCLRPLTHGFFKTPLILHPNDIIMIKLPIIDISYIEPEFRKYHALTLNVYPKLYGVKVFKRGISTVNT